MRLEHVPPIGREQWCDAGDDGKKVVFKCANGAFGGVAAVDVG